MTAFGSGLTPTQYYTKLNRLHLIYNVEDYGAVHNGVTDDTAAIQAAINAANAAGSGGVIFFPVGTYVLGGSLVGLLDGTTYNSQLTIPYLQSTSQLRKTFHFLGEVSPELCGTTGTAPDARRPKTATTGVILKSTIVGTGTFPSILCGGNYQGGSNWTNANSHTAIVENISFQYVTSASKCTIGAVNFRGMYNAIVKNVTAFPYDFDLVDSAAPNAGTCGIALPHDGCDLINVAENCHVGGFETGYVLGEHTQAGAINAVCCLYGVDIPQNYHHTHVTRVGIYWCKNAIRFINGSSYVKISGLQMEWTAELKWYDNEYVVLDASNYGHGEIHYSIVEAYVGNNDANFVKSGGVNLQCFPIGFAAASSFTVTGATDAEKLTSLIAALVAKGLIIDSTT